MHLQGGDFPAVTAIPEVQESQLTGMGSKESLIIKGKEAAMILRGEEKARILEKKAAIVMEKEGEAIIEGLGNFC